MHPQNRRGVVAERLKIAISLLLVFLCGSARPGLVAATVEPPSLPAASTRILADTAYFPALLDKIRSASHSIDLVMYLWKLPESGMGKPAELIGALGEARRRGVAVRVVLENSGYDEELNRANRKAAVRLQGEGINVIFDTPEVTTHAKLAVIDHRFCLLGSHNLSQSALGRNHELSLLLDSPQLAEELSQYLQTLLTAPQPHPTRQAPSRSAPR